jgi:hypothetical protein
VTWLRAGAWGICGEGASVSLVAPIIGNAIKPNQIATNQICFAVNMRAELGKKKKYHDKI